MAARIEEGCPDREVASYIGHGGILLAKRKPFLVEYMLNNRYTPNGSLMPPRTTRPETFEEKEEVRGSEKGNESEMHRDLSYGKTSRGLALQIT